MAKDISFNTDARKELKAGIDALANAVKTLESGRNVVIKKLWCIATKIMFQ